MSNVRARVIVSGRVQGVWFRKETQDAANRLGVFGWVKNRKDGTVEAVFEGNKSRVNAAIEWCKHGPPMARVTNVSVTWETHTGEFTDFQIAY